MNYYRCNHGTEGRGGIIFTSVQGGAQGQCACGRTVRAMPPSALRRYKIIPPKEPLLAKALRILFDETECLTRKDWGEILRGQDYQGAWEWTAYNWTTGISTPSATTLRSILDIAGRDTRLRAGEQALQAALDAPIAEAVWASKNYRLMGLPTLRHYLVAPLMESFHRIMKTLSPADQEKVLYAAGEEARKLALTKRKKTRAA